MSSAAIVGGGIIGLSVAHQLLKCGFDVTLIERGAENHDSCSIGNAGMIVPSHFTPLAAPGMVGLGLRMLMDPAGPFAIRPSLNPDLVRWCLLFAKSCSKANVDRCGPLLRDLHMASRGLYTDLAAETGNAFGLVQRGLLMLCAEEDTLAEEREVAHRAVGLGVPANVLSADGAAALDPGIDMQSAGAVYFPQDCHLDPMNLVRTLTVEVARAGAAFVWNTDVSGFETSGGRIDGVRTPRGTVRADEYVIAGGAWSRALAQTCGVRLPMQSGKGYSVTLRKPIQQPSICAILTEARVAVTPMGDTLRFAGTMEVTGLDESVDRRRVDGMFRSIARYYPAFGPDQFAGEPVWSGLRPCSPDGLPYIGRPGRFSNLIVATGHAMMGVSLAPVTGKLVAEIAANKPLSHSIDALSPDRFS